MFKLSDDQQFHQYQPNEQSLLISSHWTKKKTTIYGIGNLNPGLEQSQECDGIKPIKEIPTLFEINWCTDIFCIFSHLRYTLCCKYHLTVVYYHCREHLKTERYHLMTGFLRM